jgi:hypothetical protein
MNRKLLGLGLGAVTAIALLTGCNAAPTVQAVPAAPVAAQPSSATSPVATKPTATQPAPTKPSPKKTPTAKPSLRLGPTGLGGVHLGQSLHDALATGALKAIPGSDDGCVTRGRFKAAPPDQPGMPQDAGLVFAGKLGVTAIYAYAGVSTPEGIHLGSSFAAVKKAYPAWHNVYGPEEPTAGRSLIPVAGNAEAVYRIEVRDSKVISLAIQFQHQDCYE